MSNWKPTNGEQDEFDRVLDAVLAKYAAAEPRAGLEERVLANLRAEQARDAEHAWGRWRAIAAVAAVIVVVVALFLRPDKLSHPVVADHPSTPMEAPKERETDVISNAQRREVRPHVRVRKPALRPSPPDVAIARAPKLEQFPSPEPLSEQEKLLQNYVAQNPEQAVLLARARTEVLHRDRLEEMDSFPTGDAAMDSPERNNGTTER
jgi:hypothetical protein